MKQSDTFAVVDLETIFTVDKGGRIIQFAVTFVKNWKIVDTISFLINPNKQIPENITELTGITNKMVKDQPYFEEVADQILNLLEGKVFVAHNANFDFSFLNSLLKKYHFPKLNNSVIDTVQLSQIFFPTLASYKLGNLATELELNKKTIHHADDDSQMTGQLLIKIKQSIESTEQETLKKFSKINFELYKDTQLFIKLFTGTKESLKYLKPKQYLTLKSSKLQLRYPQNQADKISLFQNKLTPRLLQERVMDAVYTGLIDPTSNKNLIIDVPKNIGKTLGFLIPSFFAIKDDRNKQIIVVTHNKNRLTHIKNQIISKISPIFFRQEILEPFVFGSYLDNKKFEQSLNINDGKARQFAKARILIWRSHTWMGDFNEFRGNLHRTYFSEFYIEDFSKVNKQDFIFKHLTSVVNNVQLILAEQSSFSALNSLTKVIKRKDLGLIIDSTEEYQLTESVLLNSSFKMPIYFFRHDVLKIQRVSTIDLIKKLNR